MRSSTRNHIRPRIAMVSTHRYVAAKPPLGAADTGGQVVFVLELARKLAQLGDDVDIWTRRFEDQPEIDTVDSRVRVIRAPCGDTSYLIAEVTPFVFNWRCDVFGNVLAFLMHLLDVDRARQAFHFMWGVGVNQPWPVANLHPVVQAGDPDWRAYYTVNLLNLPHHYHNGGIWPFVGGMWVRFIHRIGFHDVACRELVRLAEVNRLGREREWEFNERVHGQTGRPMGKAYQAWSAASFIRACHEVEVDPAHLGED